MPCWTGFWPPKEIWTICRTCKYEDVRLFPLFCFGGVFFVVGGAGHQEHWGVGEKGWFVYLSVLGIYERYDFVVLQIFVSTLMD